MADPYFNKATFDFLRDLARNNTRDWFTENKSRYEARVRTPALRLIEALCEPLATFAPRFVASTAKSGGSLMRIYRDTRFSSDKIPYKTNIGIHFRHQAGKDVHAPGYYVHIDNHECFLGVGIWRPDAEALAAIRCAISERDRAWQQARDARAFCRDFSLAGDTLKRPPRGYSLDHPQLIDIQRKDFIAIAPLSKSTVVSTTLLKNIVKPFRASEPFMRFLCTALELPFD